MGDAASPEEWRCTYDDGARGVPLVPTQRSIDARYLPVYVSGTTFWKSIVGDMNQHATQDASVLARATALTVSRAAASVVPGVDHYDEQIPNCCVSPRT